jgi:hypothetical protein
VFRFLPATLAGFFLAGLMGGTRWALVWLVGASLFVSSWRQVLAKLKTSAISISSWAIPQQLLPFVALIWRCQVSSGTRMTGKRYTPRARVGTDAPFEIGEPRLLNCLSSPHQPHRTRTIASAPAAA